jgi:hypothetical protein
MKAEQPTRGRTAYPGASINEVVQKLGLTWPMAQKLQSVMVDAQGLTAITQTQRTPNHYDPRAETKYDEAFAAAVCACGVGLNQVSISTMRSDGHAREAPDLLLTAENQSAVGIEVVRVDETAAARAPLL